MRVNLRRTRDSRPSTKAKKPPQPVYGSSTQMAKALPGTYPAGMTKGKK